MERRNRTERRAAGDAEHVRIGQLVSQQSLERRARDGQRRADADRQSDSRQPQAEDDHILLTRKWRNSSRQFRDQGREEAPRGYMFAAQTERRDCEAEQGEEQEGDHDHRSAAGQIAIGLMRLISLISPIHGAPVGCSPLDNCSNPSTMRGPGRSTRSGVTQTIRLDRMAGVVAKSRRRSDSLTNSTPWLDGAMITSGARATTVSREN